MTSLTLSGCFDPDNAVDGKTVGGRIDGLQGSGLTVRLNGDDALTPLGSSNYAFARRLPPGSTYTVTLTTQPSYPAQECHVTHGSGTVGRSNIVNADIACVAAPTPHARAEGRVGGAALTWNAVEGAATQNLVVSTARNCDARTYGNCPGGKLFMNVASPYVVKSLQNGQPYFFRVETFYSNGTRGLSADAGALPNSLSVDGRVNEIVRTADGRVFLGGNFLRAGITTGAAVPVDLVTGGIAYPDFPIVDGKVHAVSADGSGGWYLGGDFSHVGHLPRKNLAHVLPDRTVDPDWQPGADYPVYTMAVADGRVYVAGGFDAINGISRGRLAAIDESGDVTGWNPGTNGHVSEILVSGDVVYLAGIFSIVGGLERSNLAAVRVSGEVLAWTPNPDNWVFALAMHDDVLYVGGQFGFIGGKPRYGLAALDAAGSVTAWDPFVGGPFVPGQVRCLAISDGTIYVGGSFDRVGSMPRNNLAAVDLNGALTAWTPDANGAVTDFELSGSTLYVAGGFTTVGGAARNHLAALDTGGAATSWNPDSGFNVSDIAIAGNTLYVGGDFVAFSSVARQSLAALDADGALSPWAPQAEPVSDLPIEYQVYDPVFAMAVSGDTVYVGGSLRRINGQFRALIAAIDATSGELLPWAPTIWAARPQTHMHNVREIAALGDRVFAAGNFDYVGNDMRLGLAEIDSSGVATSWNPGPKGSVAALHVSTQGLYVGGSFTTIAGVPRNNLAAFDVTGALTSWNPESNGPVTALASSANMLYIGGNFSAVGGATRHGLAAVDSGGVLAPWNPGVDGAVNALAISANAVYAGGNFNTAGGLPRDRLASFGFDGSVTPWTANANGTVSALAVSDGLIHAGGRFTQIGDSPAQGFATLAQ